VAAHEGGARRRHVAQGVERPQAAAGDRHGVCGDGREHLARAQALGGLFLPLEHHVEQHAAPRREARGGGGQEPGAERVRVHRDPERRRPVGVCSRQRRKLGSKFALEQADPLHMGAGPRAGVRRAGRLAAHDERSAPCSTSPPFLAGLALTAGFIVAIGAQNVFVLRQGLRREHVGPVVAFCAVADFAPVAAGVAGLGAVIDALPGLVSALAFGGAVFHASYGIAALRRSARSSRLAAEASSAGLTLGGALGRAAAFTLLNPHVYLDTVLLLGSVGAALPSGGQVPFVIGASIASAAWFATLG
jgi:L-lysine exporter family protein LysE/ArgO